jgi:uncharacterized protein YndB with AHSA1/START domain
MDESGPARSATATVESGTIRVGIRANRDLGYAWETLHDPRRLAGWFGDLDGPWREGRSGRIRFGDGDFFDVRVRAVVEHRLIEFDWSFLGLGPTARIRWTTTAAPDGTEITVEDHQPDRTAAEVDELVAGWTDFFERLSRYLATGEPSRYGHRDRVDGSVTVARDAALFAPETIHTWLPIASDGFGPRWFFTVDDDGPRRFRLYDWRTSPGEVTFAVEIPGAIPGAANWTRCAVRLAPVGSGWRLSFSHSGWCGLGLPDRAARLLRRRFTAAWVAALGHARELAGPR